MPNVCWDSADISDEDDIMAGVGEERGESRRLVLIEQESDPVSPRTAQDLLRIADRRRGQLIGDVVEPSSHRVNNSRSVVVDDVILPAETSVTSAASARCASRSASSTIRLSRTARAVVGPRGAARRAPRPWGRAQASSPSQRNLSKRVGWIFDGPGTEAEGSATTTDRPR